MERLFSFVMGYQYSTVIMNYNDQWVSLDSWQDTYVIYTEHEKNIGLLHFALIASLDRIS